ncbi:unnamed protein product [Meloidogyne enterolobii]|uniref:Uncharacterized protein n=4 Tax=Meloidogyne enterolobii TaxID=390850 RepID=A0ACB0ZPA2_MELEN
MLPDESFLQNYFSILRVAIISVVVYIVLGKKKKENLKDTEKKLDKNNQKNKIKEGRGKYLNIKSERDEGKIVVKKDDDKKEKEKKEEKDENKEKKKENKKEDLKEKKKKKGHFDEVIVPNTYESNETIEPMNKTKGDIYETDKMEKMLLKHDSEKSDDDSD